MTPTPPLATELATAAQALADAHANVEACRLRRDAVCRASRAKGGKITAIGRVVGLGHQMVSRICTDT